ncbi:hypothetical protein FOA43_000101 [Brettanomyces nanus]|uniref:Peroxin-3 n=1 Tax=Eeniella nana TaxID=13502 RepID=A0A875RYP4_EENNA|nr:uncharacterized protein FOA43_000101 [Brettanomyces nanus]QPG72799.1 hypothetical protein FOA43_000101 [Brettanomyces nanus]
MFQYWRDLARKHRRKIVVTTGVVTVSYLIGRYVTNKVNEFQERLREENFAKEQVKRRFKQTQSDCYMTFLSLLPVLVEPIYEELNVEQITRDLQNRRTDKSKKGQDVVGSGPGLSTVASEDFPSSYAGADSNDDNNATQPMKTKTELWNTLKIESLTRFLTLLYSESLLIIFLHLQLNVLSRKSYFETAVKLASQRVSNTLQEDDEEEEENTLAEQAFLSFSWWLLNKGWIQLKNLIQDSIEDVFGEINPRQELTIEEFATLVNAVQQKICKSIASTAADNTTQGLIVSSLLPEPDLQFFLLQQTNDVGFLSSFNANLTHTENLNKLLMELKDYLGNEQVSSILNLLVTVGISKVLDSIFADMVLKRKAIVNNEDQKMLANEQKLTKVKLASLLAAVTKQSNKLASNSLDNDILYTLNNLQELDDLSAGVYSNFEV